VVPDVVADELRIWDWNLMTTETQIRTHDRRRIGVDLGGTKIEIAVLDHKGSVLLRRRAPTPTADYAQIIHTIATLVHSVDDELGEPLTVGVGTPGSVSQATGLTRNSNTQCVNNKPLVHDLGVAIGRAVRVSNDANCFALSEAVDGAARDARVVFGVILGTGVGGGIVVDKRVLDGANGIAGEWGHNSLPWITRDELPGVLCFCGRRACIETFLCGAALRRTYLDVSGSERSVPEIAQLASEGDAKAEQAMALYEDRLARALASVINLLDPEIIVLGGGLSNLNRLSKNVPNIWKSYVFSDSIRTRLVSAVHGDSGGVRGAAWLWE